jgi:hypothetical protein
VKEPTKSLLDAIDEEVADVRFSSPPGAKPIEAHVAKKPAEPVHQMLARVVRKPRTLVLLVLLLAVVIELAMVVWTQEGTESLDQQRASTFAGDVPKPARPTSAAQPTSAPQPTSAEKPAENEPAAAPSPQVPPVQAKASPQAP